MQNKVAEHMYTAALHKITAGVQAKIVATAQVTL